MTVASIERMDGRPGPAVQYICGSSWQPSSRIENTNSSLKGLGARKKNSRVLYTIIRAFVMIGSFNVPVELNNVQYFIFIGLVRQPATQQQEVCMRNTLGTKHTAAAECYATYAYP